MHKVAGNLAQAELYTEGGPETLEQHCWRPAIYLEAPADVFNQISFLCPSLLFKPFRTLLPNLRGLTPKGGIMAVEKGSHFPGSLYSPYKQGRPLGDPPHGGLQSSRVGPASSMSLLWC